MLNLCIMCVLCHRYIQYIYVRTYVGVGKLMLDWLTHRFGPQTFTFLILASASERSNIHGDQATNLKGCTFDKPLIAIGNSSKQETWRTRWRFDFYRSVLKCSYKILKFRRSQFFFFNQFNEHTSPAKSTEKMYGLRLKRQGTGADLCCVKNKMPFKRMFY